ncbi:ADP-ribosylglycohydrolase family protein [Methanotrichaceae archaeon M04Ac]|jgi:ADP-ribosylglycohydrolase|uniref:ADP-ribosylglycohydrolase family protein n=1 Tax=Candidatus Methanocrinis alkalitolerans TaxID=3033395 RepID=A0ABT5XDG9_9EURY|nr:ADP-ribosylglycohydrolase family protein [Candidatus Methanocrinis alkalitolerans]MDF0592749.1 ADP-ribosylglycohydrolase family protein [Candidatus Methanocrinis alkalitolerans]
MAGDLLDRFCGCLLGLAVGDALGMPVEGLTRDEIRASAGEVREMLAPAADHFHSGLAPGQYTDDTEQTLILADSIIDAGFFDVERFAAKLAEWGRCWTADPGQNRGVGWTSMTAIGELLRDRPWREAGLATPTCGSAMRAAPIGLVYHCNLDLVARYADLQSLPTHSAAAARAGAVAVAAGVALSLLGFAPVKVLEMAATLTERIDRDFARRLLVVEELLDLDPAEALGEIGTSPMVSETVPAAFFCHLKLEPEEALIAAASNGGDTDSIASIAGALAGASRGSGWIPERWLFHLEDRERIERVARDLAAVASRICPGI